MAFEVRRRGDPPNLTVISNELADRPTNKDDAPASVVIVHDQPLFIGTVANALRKMGHEVTTFRDSMAALNALDNVPSFDLLITRVGFPKGTPHGLSLALTLKRKRPYLKVIFVGRSERVGYTEGIGELFPHPVDVAGLVETVGRLVERAQAQ